MWTQEIRKPTLIMSLPNRRVLEFERARIKTDLCLDTDILESLHDLLELRPPRFPFERFRITPPIFTEVPLLPSLARRLRLRPSSASPLIIAIIRVVRKQMNPALLKPSPTVLHLLFLQSDCCLLTNKQANFLTRIYQSSCN